MKNTALLLTFLLLSNFSDACTTFIVSGKSTPDGRPMMFKQRDTDVLSNSLAYFNDGKYPYVGVVNSNEEAKDMVWGGYNSVGFAIMNSAAYNNNSLDSTDNADMEGVIMKKALMTCRTVDDFEQLLKTLPKPLGVDANFGVIDAEGNGAYFETGNNSYRKVDVNDPLVAPHGFLIRTNHSFGAPLKDGFGFIRYNTANEAIMLLSETNAFTPQRIFNDISRNLYHSLTKTNLWNEMPKSKNTQEFKFFWDFIPRSSTACAMLFIGPKKGESAQRMTMWNVLGFPFTTVAIPSWGVGMNEYPEFMKPQKDAKSAICEAGLTLKSECFPYRMNGGANYINLSAVINSNGNGYLQLIQPIEGEIYARAAAVESASDADFKKKVDEFNKWVSPYVVDKYQSVLSIKLK